MNNYQKFLLNFNKRLIKTAKKLDINKNRQEAIRDVLKNNNARLAILEKEKSKYEAILSEIEEREKRLKEDCRKLPYYFLLTFIVYLTVPPIDHYLLGNPVNIIGDIIVVSIFNILFDSVFIYSYIKDTNKLRDFKEDNHTDEIEDKLARILLEKFDLEKKNDKALEMLSILQDYESRLKKLYARLKSRKHEVQVAYTEVLTTPSIKNEINSEFTKTSITRVRKRDTNG